MLRGTGGDDGGRREPQQETEAGGGVPKGFVHGDVHEAGEQGVQPLEITLTAGPNGLFGMKRPVLYFPSFEESGFTWATYYLKSLPALYYCIFIIAILVIIGVRRLDNSRIGRAWIAIREDEVAAELSGVPTT